jgi:hypothetical protein
MAKGNMILTLVAQTKQWAGGLKKAAQQTLTFGSIVKNTMRAVSTAFLGVAGAIVLFLPNFIKMGEEARKSERRLKQVADNTGLFEENLDAVTGRISEYATRLSFLTGVDDELIRSNEAVLLTFKNLADTADEAGGPFDRAVQALLDLEAAGKNLKAVQLGKALQDPVNNLTALRKAGILLTDAQKKQIAAFQESNNLLGAQDLLLKIIEDQVGGTAEATASASERMSARFEDIVETLSEAVLPSLDTLADELSTWLDSAEGQQVIEDLTDAFRDFAKWIVSPQGGKTLGEMGQTLTDMANGARDLAKFIRDVKGAIDSFTKSNMDFFDNLRLWADTTFNLPNYTAPSGTTTGNTSAPGGPVVRGITVNVSGITPSATLGKTVIAAIKDAERLGRR